MRYWIALALLVGCGQHALAATDAEITDRCSKTDATGRKYIPKENEWALARLLTDPALADSTDGCRDEMTETERRKYKDNLTLRAKRRLSEIQDIKRKNASSATAPNISTRDLEAGLRIKEKENAPPIVVRNAHGVTSIKELASVKETADGATISYSRDYQADNYITAMNGAVYLYKTLTPEKPGSLGPFVSMTLAPGIEFDQLRNRNNPAKNVDYLSPRMIAEFEVPGDTVRQLFRIAGYYNTDSRGETKIWGGSFEWQPVSNEYHISSGYRVSPSLPIGFRFDPVLHAEIEKVAAAGPLTDVSDGDNFARFGPILQAALFFVDGPDALQRLTLGAQYRRLWANTTATPSKDLKYWQADASYRLDTFGHFAIKATYRQGDLPGTGQDVRDFMTGLSVKY